MTIKQAISYAKEHQIDFFKARKLLCYMLNVNETYLVTNSEKELSENKFNKYKELLLKLKNGVPLQYITNVQEFIGMDFYVDDNVLIPQPDTEVLVEQSFSIIKTKLNQNNGKLKVLDLCTGSGAIAISIKKEFEDEIDIYASDISVKALEVAKRNEKTLIGNVIHQNKSDIDTKYKPSINFIQSDMFENINETFDIIISNPPYIKTKDIETIERDVQNEPHLALDGGEDGLKFYKIIRKNIDQYLKKQGYLLLEIGYDQKEDVLQMFENAKCIKDYAGNDRVIIWQKGNFN